MGKAVTVMNKKKVIFLLAFCFILNRGLTHCCNYLSVELTVFVEDKRYFVL